MQPVLSSPKTNTALLTLVYGCYWAFFVLFAYPSEFFPQLDVQESNFYCTVVLFLVTAGASAVVVRGGTTAADRIARSSALLVIPIVLLAVCVAFLSALRLGGTESPVFLMMVFPVLLAWLGFCLTLRVCHATACLDERRTPVVLAASLLVSFVLGVLLSLTEGVMPGDSANYIMLMLGGVLALLIVRRGAPGAAEEIVPPGRLSASATFIVALTLEFYLLGSGAFMSLSSVALGTSWYSEGWLHCVVGLVLYSGFIGYALWAVRAKRDPYPWLPVLLLCMACLYCAVLFYADVEALCCEIVVATRPLAVVLLWAAVWEWRRAKGMPTWWTAVVVPAAIFGTDVVIQALGFFGLAGSTLLMAVNGIMLATAFAMTAALVFLLSRHGLRSAASASDAVPGSSVALLFAEGAEGEAAASIDALISRFGLSAREAEVMQLLYRGNTQKKIAESLFLSLNSVQTYSKSLYRKLGVHSRQELIDLVNSEAH